MKNPFTEYVKLLPPHVDLPTFWNDDECSMLVGTSLEAALDSKLKSLDREFTMLQESTASIDWCRQYWWEPETGALAFDDWKMVDAIYRSRALDLPGTGHAVIPCIDMANHASGEDTIARYDTQDGNAVLLLYEGMRIKSGEEISITYGDNKGASEMLFSYGFIESSMVFARELFLDLDIPDDDPLKLAKKEVSGLAPGFRLYEQNESIGWEGSFIWLIVINEEDGLKFKKLQMHNGEVELQASWKDGVIQDMSNLQSSLMTEPLWDVFSLRAITLLQDRVEKQLRRLENSREYVSTLIGDKGIELHTRDCIRKLRDLEETLMLRAYKYLELQVGWPMLQGHK